VTSLLLIWALATEPGEDVVRQAMAAEMARTMKELQIPNEPRPHRVVYVVTDTELASAGATFGASLGASSRRWRTLRVEVRVGDRNFDSGNFVENIFSSDFPSPLPMEDDLLALRRELWLRTDEAYKRAVDAIGKKRAAEKAQAKSTEEAPFDFAEAKPVEGSSGEGEKTDVEALAKIGGALSAVFRDYPGIHSSRAGGEQVVVRQRLLTSDGSWKDERRSYVELAASAETQADDGMRLRTWCTFQGTSMQGLPSLEEMTKTVKAMAADVTAARKAPIPDNGNAVVLFEGRAAGQLLRRILGDHLSGTPPPRAAAGARSPVSPSDLASKLGQRIGPAFLEAYDDPRVALGPGKVPLFGSYQIDDEGVPAERVDVVRKGMLESLLMSRTPRKEITRSNGHGRGRAVAGAVRGHVGVLYVSGGKAAVTDQALRARAIKEAKAAGKDVPVYIVRHLDSTTAVGGEEGARGLGVRPLIVVRLRDGKEEPVRGITFQNLLPRSLKDLVAVARQPVVYNYLNPQEGPVIVGGAPGTIITPSVLFKDIEVKKDTEKNPRPPLYPHPAFAEK
jgi:PmbA/TldA metallopeptidase C-terminal domain